MKNETLTLLKYFWLPTLLIAGWVLFLVGLNVQDIQGQQIVLGIVLGTTLGFVSDIFKRSWDDYQKKNQVRVVAKTLLAQDALKIYQTMELYKRFMANAHVPRDINKDSFLPPTLELEYWKVLSKDKDFILLAGEKPFDDWYNKMFSFEKLNKFKEEAEAQIKDESLKGQPKPMAGIYTLAYRDTCDKNLHKKFALEFHSSEELEVLLKEK